MLSTIQDTELETIDANTGEQKFAHYADSISVTEGYVTGRPVLSLCGILFVPTRDPLKFPICPTCKEIVDALLIEED